MSICLLGKHLKLGFVTFPRHKPDLNDDAQDGEEEVAKEKDVRGDFEAIVICETVEEEDAGRSVETAREDGEDLAAVAREGIG
jgi:hypothetical protein